MDDRNPKRRRTSNEQPTGATATARAPIMSFNPTMGMCCRSCRLYVYNVHDVCYNCAERCKHCCRDSTAQGSTCPGPSPQQEEYTANMQFNAMFQEAVVAGNQRYSNTSMSDFDGLARTGQEPSVYSFVDPLATHSRDLNGNVQVKAVLQRPRDTMEL